MNNYISTYQKFQPMKNEKLWFPENVNFIFQWRMIIYAMECSLLVKTNKQSSNSKTYSKKTSNSKRKIKPNYHSWGKIYQIIYALNNELK